MKKAQEIEDLLVPVAAREKIEIVDVQYVKEADDWVQEFYR